MVWKEEYGIEGLQERKVRLIAAMDWRRMSRRDEQKGKEAKGSRRNGGAGGVINKCRPQSNSVVGVFQFIGKKKRTRYF